MSDAIEVLIIMGVPTAATGLFFWMLKKYIDKKEKEREQKEKSRETLMFNMMKGINSSLALGEATAKAVQRIPDAHCNGDMHKALEYASNTKHEIKDFLTEQGIHHIF